LRGDGADGAQESWINSTSEEKEFSTHTLDESFPFLIEERCSGLLSGILFLGTIVNCRAFKRRVLWFWWFLVLELPQGIVFVFWHGKVYLATVVVPIQGDANVTVAGPIRTDIVVFLQYFLEI
jgi:hypothetical protein